MLSSRCENNSLDYLLLKARLFLYVCFCKAHFPLQEITLMPLWAGWQRPLLWYTINEITFFPP